MAQNVGGYYRGDQVETHSLSKHLFNGLTCMVVDFKESDGRVVVEVPQSVRDTASESMPLTINLKPANLSLVQAGKEHAQATSMNQEEQKPQQQGECAKTEIGKKDNVDAEGYAKATNNANVSAAPKAEESAEIGAAASAETSAAADPVTFVVGDAVELHSLATASLNGQRGKVISLPDNQSDRVRVDLGKNGIKAFKSVNLKVVELTLEERAWKTKLDALQRAAYVKIPNDWSPKPVLMSVVSALEPCGDPKARKPRLGDIVMTVPVERRNCPELGGKSMVIDEVLDGLEKKHPNMSLERRKEIWNNLEISTSKMLETMRCSSKNKPTIMEADEKIQDGIDDWTLESCECARVVAVNETGVCMLENPRGALCELSSLSRFGFVNKIELSKSGGGYVLANQPNLLPVGCRVRTFALSSTQNNGLEGIVENYHMDKERYEVKFLDKSMALKPANLLQLVEVKLGVGHDSADASIISFDTATSKFELRVNGETRKVHFNEFVLKHTAYVDGCLQHGARVIVHGLAAETAKQWNECMAEVVGYDEEVQRYVIQVSPTAQLKIRPTNLRHH